MPTSRQVQRFRERAEECFALAATAGPNTAEKYRQLARQYLALAEAESHKPHPQAVRSTGRKMFKFGRTKVRT